MYMKICSLKLLYHLLREGQVSLPDSAAIILADETVLRPKLLKDLDFLYAPVRDVPKVCEGSFTPAIAKKIGDYYDDLPDSCQILYICCDAGQSRSAAVGAALLRASGGDDRARIWARADKYHPNPLVYRLQCQALSIRVSPIRLWQLEQQNRKACKGLFTRQKN